MVTHEGGAGAAGTSHPVWDVCLSPQHELATRMLAGSQQPSFVAQDFALVHCPRFQTPDKLNFKLFIYYFQTRGGPGKGPGGGSTRRFWTAARRCRALPKMGSPSRRCHCGFCCDPGETLSTSSRQEGGGGCISHQQFPLRCGDAATCSHHHVDTAPDACDTARCRWARQPLTEIATLALAVLPQAAERRPIGHIAPRAPF